MFPFFKPKCEAAPDRTVTDLLLKILSEIRQSKAQPASADLMRSLLGSLPATPESSVKKIENGTVKFTEAALNQLGQVADMLIEMCESLERSQEHFTAAEAADFGQVLFGRGTINGAALLKEDFEEIKRQYEQRIQPKPPFDPHHPIPQQQ